MIPPGFFITKLSSSGFAPLSRFIQAIAMKGTITTATSTRHPRTKTPLTDILSNTAQILVSLTEKLAESPSGPAPLHLIEEALRLFQKCLEVQEKQAKDSAAQSQEAQSMFDTEHNSGDVSDTEEGGVAITEDTSMDIDGGEPAQDERWASIIEPVTNSVLLDTILAQLETLTTMCGLIVGVDERAIGWIEQYAKDLIEVK
jgi:hypothetical protein